MTATSTTALDLLDDLVRIDSVNPGLDPAGAQLTIVGNYQPPRWRSTTRPHCRQGPLKRFT